MREWVFYWFRVALAYDALGEYELELEAARQARRQYPGANQSWAFFEARALAAMDRMDELDPAVEADLHEEGGNRWLPELLDYLSMDGLSATERAVADRAIDWFRSTMADQAEPTDEIRRRYGWALFAAGHVEEARDVLDALVGDSPDAVEDRGRRGVIAAIQGDVAQARDDQEWLGGLNRPYLDGWDSYYLGALAGVLGDTARAMDLVGRAFEEGRSIRPFQFIWYDALRDHPPFQELLRPKG